MRFLRISAPLVVLSVLACGQPSDDVAQTPPAEPATAEIDWFDGTVQEAFDKAAAENKPIFLYWGAVWCPPCHYLKEKIFTRPEFVEQSRAFVAVYLDGDTERAQAWGDKLGTFGYPTVIVMNPQGQEVVRMSTDVPVEEYNRVLESALAKLRPLPEVLEETLAATPGEADPESLRLLANHSWGQDAAFDFEGREAFDTFSALYAATPDSMPIEKSRFLGLMLDEATHPSGDEADAEPFFEPDQLPGLRRAVEALLADPEQRNSNVYFVCFSPRETIELLEPVAGEGRDSLMQTWAEAGAKLENDESLPVTERLYGINVRIELARMRAGEPAEGEEPPPLPPEVLDHLRERIAWANEAVTGEGELQGVMNTMANLLEDAGLLEETETLVLERMDDTEAPYYYMSWMADLREEAGDAPGAIDWSRRAWESSRGPYTRFQWGSGHVQTLMRLAPEDTEAIESTSLAVLDELLPLDDAFSHRNQRRLERLEASYREWAEDAQRRAAVDRIRDHVRAACDRWPDDRGEDSARNRCEAFLTEDHDA